MTQKNVEIANIVGISLRDLLTQTLTEMSTYNIRGGRELPASKADFNRNL
jgi:hypothetical protein